MSLKSVLAALAAFVTTFALLWGLDDGPGWRYGYTYAGDELQVLCQARALAETGDPLTPTRLGAPFVGDWRTFPMRVPLATMIVAAGQHAGLSDFQAIYLNWACMTGLAAAMAFAALRELGLSRTAAFALGCAYALQSYTWEHNLWHFHCYYPWVPGMTLIWLRLAQGRGDPGQWPRWLLLNAFLQGLETLYYSYFFLLFAPLAAAWGWRRREAGWSRRALQVLAALALGLTIQVLLICVRGSAPPPPSGSAPVIQTQRPAPLLTGRKAKDAERFGLRLRNLLCPRPNHPLPPWAWLEDRLDRSFEGRHQVHQREQDESTRGRLGTLASLGLLLGLAGLLRQPGRVRSGDWPALAAAAAWLVLALASSGGVTPLFNALVFDKFRCYNRLIVYLSFLCLAVLGRALDASRLRPGLWLLVPLAALDQFQPHDAYQGGHYPPLPARIEADRRWVKQVEAVLPPAAAVYQLPRHRAFSQADIGLHKEYDHAIGYLFSQRLRWSWGCLTGPQDDWQRRLDEQPPPEQLQELVRAGFAAIWFDRWGYTQEDPNNWAQNLPHWLGPALAVSEDGRYQLYRLTGEGWRQRGQVAELPAPPVLTPAQARRVRLKGVATPAGPLRWLSGTRVLVRARIENGADVPLSGVGLHPLWLTYHWADADGKIVVQDGNRTPLAPLQSGDAYELAVPVAVPLDPGRYRLQLRIQQLRGPWLEGKGVAVPDDLAVDVVRH